ncbi:MAG TPA: hypothetical protein VM389_01910, partial [Phycisphaerae bacterium]|nr:hypothetical protein [Phycisphaerae bacterium]
REWLGRLRHRDKYARFRRSLSRSAVPILASAVILVGLFCGWVLGRAEVSAVQRMTAAGTLDFRNEVERSNFRLLRDRFEKRHEEMLAEFLGSAEP